MFNDGLHFQFMDCEGFGTQNVILVEHFGILCYFKYYHIVSATIQNISLLASAFKGTFIYCK